MTLTGLVLEIQSTLYSTLGHYSNEIHVHSSPKEVHMKTTLIF